MHDFARMIYLFSYCDNAPYDSNDVDDEIDHRIMRYEHIYMARFGLAVTQNDYSQEIILHLKKWVHSHLKQNI